MYNIYTFDQELRNKLYSRSHKCAFIGYGGYEYGYCLWDYQHNKVIRVKIWYSMRLACTMTGWKKEWENSRKRLYWAWWTKSQNNAFIWKGKEIVQNVVEQQVFEKTEGDEELQVVSDCSSSSSEDVPQLRRSTHIRKPI